MDICATWIRLYAGDVSIVDMLSEWSAAHGVFRPLCAHPVIGSGGEVKWNSGGYG